jgi:tetratricopeptide (TPR) repeat protein
MRSSSQRGVGAVLLAVGCAAIALASVSCRDGSPRSRCVEAMKREDFAAALPACEVSYSETKSDEDLYFVATASFSSKECTSALPILERVPPHVHRGEVLLKRAYCYRMIDRRDVAAALTKEALLEFQRSAQSEGIAKANMGLAQIYLERGELDSALEAVNESMKIVRTGGPGFKSNTVSGALVTLVDVYCRMANYDAARAVLDDALHWKLQPRGVAWVRLREAAFYEETGDFSHAMESLESIEKLKHGDGRVDSQRRYYLPWLHYYLGDGDKARLLLAKASEQKKLPFDALLLSSYLAAEKEDWEAAKAFLRQATTKPPPDEDWRWERERANAELAEQLGDYQKAEGYYRNAIAYISSLRIASPKTAAYFVASHRGPFEGLISLLAAQERWVEALKVVMLLDAVDLLRVTAILQGRENISFGSYYEMGTTRLEDPFKAVDAIYQDVIARWSKQGELSIVVAAPALKVGPRKQRGRLAYRIIVRDSVVSGQSIGDADEIRDLVERPWSDDTARGLATALVPEGGNGQPLFVLGIGMLGKVPLGALQEADGSLTSSRRPLLRSIALRQDVDVPPMNPTSVVIGADPAKAAPHLIGDASIATAALMKSQPSETVRRFGLGTSLPAGRDALWETKNADVFYLAAHIHDVEGQPAILLDDGDVFKDELEEQGFAPRLAVLASCRAAGSGDEAGLGSIAAALLKSGTWRVVAADRQVDDEPTRLFMEAFLAEPDWRNDPARALARVQQAARSGPIKGVTISPQVWGAFVVLARAPYVPAPKTALAP